MSSPESNKYESKSSPVKDSPIFGYVSSLSPIQPVNARPTSQLYGNIDVPSPQLVFKTPNFIRPRISGLLERSQHPASPDYANKIREFSDMTGASLSLTATQLVSYNGKECTSGDPSPNQSCTSPSNCVDTFLADPPENGDKSSSSPEFCVNRAAKSVEDNDTDRCENQLKCLKKDLLRDHLGTPAISVSEKTDYDTQNPTSIVLHFLPLNQDAYPPNNSQDNTISIEKSPIVVHVANAEDTNLKAPHEAEEDAGNASIASQITEIHEGSITEQQEPHATDHSFLSRAKDCDIAICKEENNMTSKFICQSEPDLKVQAASTGQSDDLECNPQLHPGSPQETQSFHGHIDEVVQMPSASTGSQISYDQEECAQHQRCNRKRLQFEAAENLRISRRNSFNCITEASNADSQITPLEVEPVNSSLPKSITMSSHKQMIRSVPVNVLCKLSNNVDRSGQCKALPVIVPRPAGVGLHLNSIGSAVSMSCNSNVQLLERSAFVQEKALGEDKDQVPEKPLHYSGNENNEEKQQGNQVFRLQHSSISYQSPLSVEPLNKSVPSEFIERCMTPCIMKNVHSEKAKRSEESTQTSPRKQRKKTPESDGHKRCNCKRSKCLKLYCDCFAAGSFCSEACACHDCSNRLEYEGTVLETRQQIESRNPLAFAPKVVVRASDPPKTRGDNKPTPTSARHKRGCNCKRSLCLKKYCECFQAGVGCSLGCRCEGCKNTFGTKDGCEVSEMVVEHKRLQEGGFERNLSGEPENIVLKQRVSTNKQCDSRFSPLTPVVPKSMGNDVPEAQLPAGYYPSPDTVASIVQSYEPSAEKSGSSSFIPYDIESESHNEGKLDPFSPGWEGFQDLCNLSPFLKTSSSIGGSSCVSKTGDRKILQMRLFQESGRTSLGSICWRSSPMTPLHQFGERKYVQEPDSGGVLHCNPEDGTPEILKETRSPIKSVKATSPNQKRVSPPYHATGGGTSSPSGLTSVRKFILKSVPAFPPLTPYSENNGEDGT